MAELVVVDKEQLENDLTVVADAIREKGGTTEQLAFPQGMKRAVEAIQNGDSYHDVFWDAYQQNGERRSYVRSFSGGNSGQSFCWSDVNFKPKYDFIVSEYNYFMDNTDITDFCGILEQQGIIFDNETYNKARSGVVLVKFFESCKKLTTVPPFYIGHGSTVQELIVNCPLVKKVELLGINQDCTFINVLRNCTGIEELILSGTIGKNFAIAQCPALNDASIQNVIDCLADLTGATAQTVTFHADVKAKLTEEQIATITGKNWTLA